MVSIVLLLALAPRLEAQDCSRSWSYTSNFFASTRADKAREYLPSPVKPVVVAIVDTGADINHIGLKDQLWVNKKEIPNNGIDDDKNGYVDDINGFDFYKDKGGFLTETSGTSHGTHVAGIIAANPNSGVCGIASGYVDLMILNFNKPSPRSASAFVRDREALAQNIALSIRYAVDNGASIINLSLNGDKPVKIEEEAIKYANSKGVLVVTAAGNTTSNNDVTKTYPADYNLPNIIRVAAIDSNGRIPYFSNWGKSSVDILAPGVGIISSVVGDNYLEKDGTSQAAPHVSAALALIKVQHPTWSAKQVKSHLLSSVVPNPYYKDKIKQAGNLNLLMALQSPVTKDITEIFKSQSLAVDSFADKEGNFIKDVSCLLCGPRILCGSVDIKVKEENREDTTSLKAVCEKRNLEFLVKESASSINDSEIGFFNLISEIYAMSPTEEGKKSLISNGFLLSDLIKQLGFQSYNKLRSIHFLIPVLSVRDYSKYSNQNDSLEYYYPAYIQDLINTPSPLLEHKGNAYFVTGTVPSPAIMDRMTKLLPISDTITYAANVNLESLSIYKLGLAPKKKNDKPLIAKLLRPLEIPKIKDLKEIRKQVYLKLNEHHLADKDVKNLIPKKYQNNPELIKHYQSLLSNPATIVSSAPAKRGAENSSSRSSVGNFSAPTPNKKAILGNPDPQVVAIQQAQIKKVSIITKRIERTPIYQNFKATSEVSQKRLESPVVARLSQGSDVNAWARRYPDYNLAIREKNPAYFTSKSSKGTEARVTRVKPIQRRSMASGSVAMPVMPIGNFRQSGRSELAISQYSGGGINRPAPLITNRASTTTATLPAKVSPSTQPATSASANTIKNSPVVAAKTSSQTQASTKRRRIGSRVEVTGKIKCSPENWTTFLTEVVAFRGPRTQGEDYCTQRYSDNLFCNAITGEEQLNYNKNCMVDGLESTSCAQIAFDETAKLCKTYIDYGKENLTQEDLSNCYAALSTFICASPACEGEVSYENEDLVKALSHNGLDGYLARRVQLRGPASTLSTFMPHDRTFNLFLGDKYEIASWSDDMKKSRINSKYEDLVGRYEKIRIFNKLYPKNACHKIRSGNSANDGRY
ncbi:MAG: S8 family serine peptidase [Bdellovibrionales bacterium]|nr:S8 family serine peptidase [Bdellovibrionales bacterium]